MKETMNQQLKIYLSYITIFALCLGVYLAIVGKLDLLAMLAGAALMVALQAYFKDQDAK